MQCTTCGTDFTATRAWSKYCSKKCKHNNPDKRQYTQQYQQSRRLLINNIKLQLGCSRCGYNEHPAALEFNHIRGVKLFNISQDPKRSMKAILDEIEKCEVLCSNCHRIHTHENNHYHSKRGVDND